MKQSFYLVAGLGQTGWSIIRHLHRQNKPFAVFDTRKEAPGLMTLRTDFPNIDLFLEHIPTEALARFTDIIVSPGVPLETPCLQQAMQMGISIYGDIECLARTIKAPVIAITGTNGKSTVTTLVGEMAKAAGLNVAVAGNIGTPVLDLLDENNYDLWVLEVSSFQLDLTHSLKPLAATILNVTPDHLDRHHTMSAYTQAKQRVYLQAKTKLYNRQDQLTIPLDDTEKDSMVISFGFDAPAAGNWGIINQKEGIFLAKGDECLFPVNSLLIKGVHNWLNALAACALADSAGIALSSIVQVLSQFAGLPHRCQWVRTLDGVDWINDSKGTNVGATISAINGIGGSLQGKIILIAGGQGKGADFKDLTKPISEFVRSVVLIGEDADKIEAALSGIVPIFRAQSLDDAINSAKTHAKSGDIVLLSPACASMDMFENFHHRGSVFTSLVNQL